MSSIRLNVVDFSQTMSGEVDGSIGHAAIAALSAEPETINELELAVARFIKPLVGRSPFRSLYAGRNLEPSAAGIVIIDLAARIIMLDSSYQAPMLVGESSEEGAGETDSTQGLSLAIDPDLPVSPEPTNDLAHRIAPAIYAISYHNGEHLTDVCVPYRLPEDWLFLSSVPEYLDAVNERRAHRQQIHWDDPREVLWGTPLRNFLANAIITAADLENEDLFREIHTAWLVTDREDLGGKSPRDVMLAKKDFIDFDLHSREMQWSMVGECPPPLLPNAHAYRFAGFGTHEVVLNYDLIRWLLTRSAKRVGGDRRVSVADEAKCMERDQHTWLETHDHENQGKAPALVMEWERRRIPLAISGKEAMVDKDCPVCQAMAEDLELYFWHLDGSAMEDCFEFSFFKTREEWEAERRSWEEFSKNFERARGSGVAGGA